MIVFLLVLLFLPHPPCLWVLIQSYWDVYRGMRHFDLFVDFRGKSLGNTTAIVFKFTWVKSFCLLENNLCNRRKPCIRRRDQGGGGQTESFWTLLIISWDVRMGHIWHESEGSKVGLFERVQLNHLESSHWYFGHSLNRQLPLRGWLHATKATCVDLIYSSQLFQVIIVIPMSQVNKMRQKVQHLP